MTGRVTLTNCVGSLARGVEWCAHLILNNSKMKLTGRLSTIRVAELTIKNSVLEFFGSAQGNKQCIVKCSRGGSYVESDFIIDGSQLVLSEGANLMIRPIYILGFEMVKIVNTTIINELIKQGRAEFYSYFSIDTNTLEIISTTIKNMSLSLVDAIVEDNSLEIDALYNTNAKKMYNIVRSHLLIDKNLSNNATDMANMINISAIKGDYNVLNVIGTRIGIYTGKTHRWIRFANIEKDLLINVDQSLFVGSETISVTNTPKYKFVVGSNVTESSADVLFLNPS